MDSSSHRGSRPELLTVRDQAQATALLQPQRLRLLEGLVEPDSAAGLARRLHLPLQQLNHHLRELERVGLVELAKGEAARQLRRARAGGDGEPIRDQP